jgi:hypothetical protein
VGLAQGQAQGLGEQLFWAAKLGNTAEVALLLFSFAPVNYRGPEQWTPLIVAACKGHLEVVFLLFKHGADPDAVDTDGLNAVMAAAISGHHSVVEFLAENGADLSLVNRNKSNALMFASRGGHLDVAQALCHRIPICINERNKLGSDALFFAALNAHAALSVFLISQGADPRIRGQDGFSALTHFGRYGSAPVMPDEQNRMQEQLLAAWEAGCHPDARWLRRRGLMLALVGSKLRPMARVLAAQRQIQATMDLRAPLPPIDHSTPQANWNYLPAEVLGNEGIVRCVVEKI